MKRKYNITKNDQDEDDTFIATKSADVNKEENEKSYDENIIQEDSKKTNDDQPEKIESVECVEHKTNQCLKESEQKQEEKETEIVTKKEKETEPTELSQKRTEKQIIDLSNENDVFETGQEELPMPNDQIRDVDETFRIGYQYLREQKLFNWKFFIQDSMTGNKVIHSILKQRQLIISFTFASSAVLHVLEDTIKHEIAHILVGVNEKHNEKWRQTALTLNCNPNISCRLFSPVKNVEKVESMQQPVRYKFRQYCANGCWSKKLTRRPAGFSHDLLKFHCIQCKAPVSIEPLT